MSPKLTASWLFSPPLQTLFHVFDKEGAILRVVGGAVRNSLAGDPVGDIDLAIDRDPYWVLHLLKTHDILAIPTGIEHGTITAVLEKEPYQITTLRVDVKTFGRKAEVAFTEDWVQDALRRDFTINAIYADQNGTLFDPVGGMRDLETRTLRFIGEASQRIQEDYLRILRFFRFSARYGREPYNEEGLKACAHYAPRLSELSRERVTDEFLKILSLPSPFYTLKVMDETGVLAQILHPRNWEHLKALLSLETETHRPLNPFLRLAALGPKLEEIKTHLRLSNKQLKTLVFLSHDHSPLTENSFKDQAYKLGKDTTFDLAFFQIAHQISAKVLPLTDGASLFKALEKKYGAWTVPPFPLTGHDVLASQIPSGQKVGTILRTAEKWWLENDLEPDREACLRYLETLL